MPVTFIAKPGNCTLSLPQSSEKCPDHVSTLINPATSDIEAWFLELQWMLDVGPWSFYEFRFLKHNMSLIPCPNYIAGRWLQPKTATTPVFNPSTGDTIAECPVSTAQIVDEAVQSAAAAFPAWRDTPAVERARVFF